MPGQLVEPQQLPVIQAAPRHPTRQKRDSVFRLWKYSLGILIPLFSLLTLIAVSSWLAHSVEVVETPTGQLDARETSRAIAQAPAIRASTLTGIEVAQVPDQNQKPHRLSSQIGLAASVSNHRPDRDKESADASAADSVSQTKAKKAAANRNQAVGNSTGSTKIELRDEDRVSAENPFESEQLFEPQTTLDLLVFERLQQLDIKPARLCSDEVFLRRIYIDLIGTLPTADEARQFLDDRYPQKRSRLIEELMERPEFADYWAMKWSDILRVKAEFPIKLWPNAAQAYHRWIRNSLANNMAYDDFAYELLTSSGSNFRAPQVNFYRAVQSQEPREIAQAVALTFLCERADQWPEDRLAGLSQFFSKVGYKPTGEWKEEIVFFDRRLGGESGESVPVQAVYPNGARAVIPIGQDPRAVFAKWLIDDKNPWFAKAVANRVWHWLTGRGIVDPPDDVRPDNPPSNRALLKHLGDELIASDYDMRHLYRIILNSQTYQLACIPQSEDSHAAENFAHYSVRRLDAEVLIDAICQITGTTESYTSIIPEPFTFLPDGQRAISLPDGSITSSFLEMFGRPPRDSGLESERNNRLSSAQALHLLNSNHLRNKLKQGSGMKNLLRRADKTDTAAERLYLTILSRRPTADEEAMVADRCRTPNGARDVAWALINSDEFLFRH